MALQHSRQISYYSKSLFVSDLYLVQGALTCWQIVYCENLGVHDAPHSPLAIKVQSKEWGL